MNTKYCFLSQWQCANTWLHRHDILQQLLDFSPVSALGYHHSKTFRLSKKVAFTEALKALRGKIIHIQEVYFYEDKSLAFPY